MPPRVATRTVRLRPSARTAAHLERMRLLTYPMALAQAAATVPLIHSPTLDRGDVAGAPSGRPLADALSSFNRTGSQAPPPAPPPAAGGPSNAMQEQPEETQARRRDSADGAGGGAAGMLPAPRRWVRDADELCVASIHRSNNINRINSYVATYKFDDPQWRPLLLPEVHVLPKPRRSNSRSTGSSGGGGTAGGSGAPSRSTLDGYEVFIDYNKLVTLELISRHANYALRHLVQKGHAMYLINFAQHSVVQMRGLVEASYVTCAYGIRGERLRTHIVHTGPVDVREVLEIHPETRHVSYNLKKPHVRRGVVAMSTVEGYGTWFQRKPMLWQRTRRIGALQSQMGSYDYQLCGSAAVGRLRAHEVALLEPHVRLLGSGGGAEAVGLVASSQVAQNERLYMGQFEAPVLTAVDAVHQLIHRTALHHQLLRPAVTDAPDAGVANTDGPSAYEDPRVQELRRLAGMERYLPVSWVTRTPPPYVPLESDLPFRIQLSRPAVIHTDERGRDGQAHAAAFPTGGAVGSPFVRGVPLSLFEYNIHQGVDHYVFDDAPSARPMKWWNQKSNMPYNGYVYGMRSGLLDYVEPAEIIENPLAPPSTAAASKAAAASPHGRRRRRSATRAQSPRASPSPGVEGGVNEEEPPHVDEPTAPTTRVSPLPELEAGDADGALPLSSQRLRLEPEELPAGAEELRGNEDGRRQETAAAWAADGMDASVADRPPLHTLIPPTSTAQRRLRRYARGVAAAHAAAASAPDGSASGSSHPRGEEAGGAAAGAAAVAPPLDRRADALLQRQLRLRRLRRQRRSPSPAAAPASAPERPGGDCTPPHE